MKWKTASLTDAQNDIINKKATEPPFSGEYENNVENGSYLCRQCGLALFRTTFQFHSGCGWPSFDQSLKGAILKQPDASLKSHPRTEILCARCKGHLGHVFSGEGFTTNNIRYCVNSASLDFITDQKVTDTEEAIFAAGCFWGVEYFFKKKKGVLKTQVGYTGGTSKNPSYETICRGNTGHYEAVRVIYDPLQVSYEALVKFFFEIHDFSQQNGQGPDRGEQYLSVAFFYDDTQKKTILKIITILEQQNYFVATQILPVSPFWLAECYHQNYYEKTQKTPYCHQYIKRFL